MAKQRKFNLKQVEKGGRTAMERSIILIGNEAKNFFVNTFREQGFQDQTFQPWKRRKIKDSKRGRYQYWQEQGTDDKAGKRHRVKGTVRSVKMGRAILVDSGDLRRSIVREPVNKSQLQVKISTDLPYAKIHNEGGTMKNGGKMPKRQFMGDSYKLNELCKKIIVSQLDKIFK